MTVPGHRQADRKRLSVFKKTHWYDSAASRTVDSFECGYASGAEHGGNVPVRLEWHRSGKVYRLWKLFGDFTQDEIFWRAMKNNTIWMLLFLTVPLIIGMLVAVMVTRVKHLQMVYRTVIFIPYVIASITAGQNLGCAAQSLFRHSHSIQNAWLEWIGFDFLAWKQKHRSLHGCFCGQLALVGLCDGAVCSGASSG